MIIYTQLIASTDNATINQLEAQGYTNPHDLPNKYAFPVFVVDLVLKEIFSTNATCMAAFYSFGNRPIVLDFERLKEKLLKIEE